MRLSTKDVRSKEEGFVQCVHFADRGEEVFQMRTSALFGFFEIYSVSARTRGFEQVRIIYGQEGRGDQFWAESFMDGP